MCFNSFDLNKFKAEKKTLSLVVKFENNGLFSTCDDHSKDLNRICFFMQAKC